MKLTCVVVAGLLYFAPFGLSQNSSQPTQSSPSGASPEMQPGGGQESSSRDTRIDTSAPKDDVKNHPNSGTALDDSSSDVQEMHSWNPYKAAKDDEVGDYYFRLKNYKAAAARYQDALIWKNNDAVANFRLGECFERMNQREDAIEHYQAYLKILPQGPESKHARKALEKLGAAAEKSNQ